MNKKHVNVITGNSKIVRGINRVTILNMIRESQPISRITIARLTGLTKSTVSIIVSQLLEEGLIYETVNGDKNIGRNPIDLRLKLEKYFVGAININFSVTRLAIVDIDGSIKVMSSLNTKAQNPEKFIELCIKELMNLCKKQNIKELEGIGISIGGIVDSKNLVVNFAPNLGWEDFNIGKWVRKYQPNLKNIVIGNAAKSSALAELWFGSHEVDLSNFVFLSISEGIGSGIMVNNKLLEGGYEASGEFGHMVIYEGGVPCSCGNYGCWESYASDKATVKRFTARKIGELGQTVDFLMQDIIDLAKKGDELAVEVLKQTGYYLGLGISNIIKAIDPNTIIVGGKITQVWNLIYSDMNNVVKQRSYFGKKRNIKILPTSLRAKPHLLGAAALAIREIFDGYIITNN